MIGMIPAFIAVDVERERSDGGAWDLRENHGEAMEMAKSERTLRGKRGKGVCS